LQAQARELGIIGEDDEGEPAEPLSLEEFRTRKAAKP
jgi:hypothetical protein